MRRLMAVITLVLLVLLHVFALGRTAAMRKDLPRGDASAMVLPSPLLRITSLGFKGIVADFIFLDVIIYYGSTLDRTEQPYVKEWEWKWFERSLHTATDLDPYFFDPYYFGNAIFSWESHRIKEANALLEKGIAARTWDWILPFFAGFNNFYFLGENEKAAEYIMEASRRPGANPMLASLASKLAYKERRTETSIQFLEETLKRMDDAAIQKDLQKRIEALQRIYVLEQAVALYRQRFKEYPPKLESLIQRGIIKEVPEDPYGGKFFLAEDGTVKSTTDNLLLPTERRRNR